MTARFERFDPTPGCSCRLVLTYAAPSTAGGKSSADSDIVEARYVDLVRNDRVVQAVIAIPARITRTLRKESERRLS